MLKSKKMLPQSEKHEQKGSVQPFLPLSFYYLLNFCGF